MAERRFPVRIRLGVPPDGFGRRHTEMTAWLDENCGADGWAMTPYGMRGVPNDAVSIYFLDATLAGAFVARWCAGSRVDTEGGCSGFATMSRRRGSGRGCIGRLNLSKSGRIAVDAIAALPDRFYCISEIQRLRNLLYLYFGLYTECISSSSSYYLGYLHGSKN
jgi:hypothetical protein